MAQKKKDKKKPKVEMKPSVQKKRKKKKAHEFHLLNGRGHAYIRSTYNNTIVTITDQHGNTVAWGSAGRAGFAGPKQSTPYAAQQVVKQIADELKDKGVKSVDVFVKGPGSGREAAVRALSVHGIQVASIKDVTPIPHNGVRSPKPRRV